MLYPEPPPIQGPPGVSLSHSRGVPSRNSLTSSHSPVYHNRWRGRILPGYTSSVKGFTGLRFGHAPPPLRRKVIMGIPLRVVDPFPERPREPGMMWRYSERDEPDRECWWIVLPRHPDMGTPGHPSEISWRTTDHASDPPHERWEVSGTPPLITVTPSIDVLRHVPNPAYVSGGTEPSHIRSGSYWHGFITNGELV